MECRGLVGLLRDFPDWKIEVHELGTAWIAVRRTGTATRVLAAHDPDALREKIEKAASEGYEMP